MTTATEVKVKPGHYYEIVMESNRVLVGKIAGYVMDPNTSPVTHTLYLKGVKEDGLTVIDTRTIRRMNEVQEMSLHIHV
ncbi:MAG: hypothetical protein ACYCW6_07290 [Candidatus Xenobia bacterium]